MTNKMNKEQECINCGLLKSTCEMLGGSVWAKHCMKIEGKKHEFSTGEMWYPESITRVPLNDGFWQVCDEGLVPKLVTATSTKQIYANYQGRWVINREPVVNIYKVTCE